MAVAASRRLTACAPRRGLKGGSVRARAPHASAPLRTAAFAMAAEGSRRRGHDEAAELLRGLSAACTPEWAHVAPRGGGGADADATFAITSGWSQRAPADGGKRSFARTFAASAGGAALETTAPTSAELPAVELRCPSPSGDRVFVLRKAGEGGKRVAQLWGKCGLEWEVEVPEALHGAPCGGEPFGGADWAPDESAVAYAADAPRDKRDAFRADAPAAVGGEAAPAQVQGRTWEPTPAYAPDWGEAQAGTRRAAVFVAEAATGAVAPLAAPPEAAGGTRASAAQPVWTSAAGLAFTAWEHPDGHRPGLAHCFNRKSAVCWAPSPHAAGREEGAAEAALVAQPGGSGASPVVSADGTRLYFLSHARALETGCHMARPDLCSVPWEGGDEAAAAARAAAGATIETVALSSSSDDDADELAALGGLWLTRLRRWNLCMKGWLVATTQWRAAKRVVAIELATGTTHLLPSPAEALGGAEFAPFSEDGSDGENACSVDLLFGASSADCSAAAAFVAAVSTPAAPPRLVVLVAAPAGSDVAWSWEPLTEAQRSTPALTRAAEASWRVLQIPPPSGSPDTDCGSVVLLTPPGGVTATRGIVLLPHGGPHTAAPTAYIMSAAMFAQMGYAVAMPNYRGSFGYGDDFLTALPGNVGETDVRDCMAGLRVCAQALGAEDKPAVVWGGSHGGFLGGHLLGQHPEAFAAAALRNGVVRVCVCVCVCVCVHFHLELTWVFRSL